MGPTSPLLPAKIKFEKSDIFALSRILFLFLIFNLLKFVASDRICLGNLTFSNVAPEPPLLPWLLFLRPTGQDAPPEKVCPASAPDHEARLRTTRGDSLQDASPAKSKEADDGEPGSCRGAGSVVRFSVMKSCAESYLTARPDDDPLLMPS